MVKRSRWARLAAMVGAVCTLGALAVTAPATADPSGVTGRDLPIFTSTGAIIDPLDESLPHNPNQEFIFPSVFHAGAHFEDPLGEWYIYYAPHDDPGGINLMYADSLDGPWTPYENNPVVANEWLPYFSVPHTSSPDAFWNQREKTMFLYFHGDNRITRYATTDDGVNFRYGGPAVTTEQVDAAQPDTRATETSYARVFSLPVPSGDYRYGMFFMTNYSDNVRRINLALSEDGRVWDVQDEPIVSPTDVEGANVAGADLWSWRGQQYVIYGSTVGTIFARPLSNDLSIVGDPEPLFVPEPAPPEAGRASAPQIVSEGGSTHLFYEYGERSHTTIGHAVIDPDGVRDPLNTHVCDPMYALDPGPGSDEFDGTELDTSLWSENVRPELAEDVVADGALQMPTYVGNSTTAPLIQQPLPGDAWEVTTKLSLDPTENFQQAGLIARADDANSARVDLSHVSAGQRIDFVWRHNGVDRINTWTMEDSVMAPEDMGESIWLRMTSNGDYVTASYSIDGATFANLGRALPLDELNPTTVGPFAYRGPDATTEITASFDWVRFTPDPVPDC